MIDQSRVHSQTFRLSFFVIFQKLEFSVFKSIVTSIFTTLSSNVNAWICIALCQWTSLMHLGNLIFKILVLFLLYNYYDICHVLYLVQCGEVLTKLCTNLLQSRHRQLFQFTRLLQTTQEWRSTQTIQLLMHSTHHCNGLSHYTHGSFGIVVTASVTSTK